LLWFRPTIADDTNVTTADVLAHNLPTLSAGQEEPSLAEARQYVHNLVAEQQSAQAAARPPTPSTTTTTRPRTTTTTKPKPRSTTPTTR
jgi:hypothetical protein